MVSTSLRHRLPCRL